MGDKHFKSLSLLWDQHEAEVTAEHTGDRSVIGCLLDAAILFADMRGYSSLVLKFKDDPRAAAFLAHHYAALIENWCLINQRVRGEVARAFLDKIVGDEMMLVIPGKKAPAMKCALTLASAFLAGPGLYNSRVGVHWGQIWLGDVGLRPGANRDEHFRVITAMGQTVNIAARLANQAQENEVVLLLDTSTGLVFPQEYGIKHDTAPLKGVSDVPMRLLRLVRTDFLSGRDGSPDAIEVVKSYLEKAGDPVRRELGPQI